MNSRLFYVYRIYSSLKLYALRPVEEEMFMVPAQSHLFPEQFLFAVKYRVQHLAGISKTLIGFFL